MAESQGGSDKSEKPTEKRLRQSREKGQVARSRELNTLIIVMAGAGGLLATGGSIGNVLLGIMQENFSLPRDVLMDTNSMALWLGGSGLVVFEALLPLLIALFIASIVGSVALGGFMFSAEPMMFNFSRMDPLAGVKRMFSLRALVELLKALAKFFVILLVSLFVLSAYTDDLIDIAGEPKESAILHSIEVVGWCALWLSFGLLLIAAVDVPFQYWDNRQKLMMTKQEIRDEYKDSEGRPEVKQRIRRLQREMATRRMMQAVPQADVVITNPTHFAVALKYEAEKGRAPILLAKGGDFTALKIREIAEEHGVIVLESPPLARSIYYTTELDREIPAGLYLAVAQVLAYVYQVRQYQAGKGKRPKPLKDLPIPQDLQRDS